MTRAITFTIALLVSGAAAIAAERDPRPELVIWHSESCPECRRLVHDVRRVPGFARLLQTRFRLHWVNRDHHPKEAQTRGVTRLPTFEVWVHREAPPGVAAGYCDPSALLRQLELLRSRAASPAASPPTHREDSTSGPEAAPLPAPDRELSCPAPSPLPGAVTTLQEDVEAILQQLEGQQERWQRSQNALLQGVQKAFDASIAKLPRPQPLDPILEELRAQRMQQEVAATPQRSSESIDANFPPDVATPFPRRLDEARALLELRQAEGRVPLLDALRGMFLDDEREKILASEDAEAKRVIHELMGAIDDRIDEVAPLVHKDRVMRVNQNVGSPTSPPNDDLQREVEAMRAVAEATATLTADEFTRVVEWLVARRKKQDASEGRVPMPIGDPGKEQFRRAIVTLRNLHIAAALSPLFTMRNELIANDELSDRGGFDDPTRDHLIQHLVHCDRWRRRVTHNPDQVDLGDKIEKAIDTKQQIDIGENPFGGDDVQNQSGGLIDLPFALDGTDPDIPLTSSLQLKSTHSIVLLGAIDKAIVAWTRLNSRDRTRFITSYDSMRIYGHYQEILGYLTAFGGDKNRVDVAQVLPTDEPLGPDDSPNRKGESTGPAS
ncbi:Uncharacterized protein SCF082_LOCUS5769 [Durusdinium trenchii]|uniref:Thioredoxin domain-containing protein n=1 Tax=Durusdinium trenchii TaxID=1381693 RepID=A0ABP0IBK7_9DINO